MSDTDSHTRRRFLGGGLGLAAGALTGSTAEARAAVPLSSLWSEMNRRVELLRRSATLTADYDRFLQTQDLAQDEVSLRDYLRVHVAFESTRSGGLWQLRWAVTNQQPQSDRIWAQWRGMKTDAFPVAPEVATAIAECDELSALFAFVAYRLGVRGVGLFWPVWNHVVAVWTIPTRVGGRPRRVVVPTSQVLLGPDATLGTDEFDPWTQRKIYEYRRADAAPSTTLPVELADFFLHQIDTHADKSSVDLSAERNRRIVRIGGVD